MYKIKKSNSKTNINIFIHCILIALPVAILVWINTPESLVMAFVLFISGSIISYSLQNKKVRDILVKLF